MPTYIQRYHSENGTTHVHPSAYKNFYKNTHTPEEIEARQKTYRPLDNANMVRFYDKAVKASGGFCVGFEIEKEDESVRNSLYFSDFKVALPQWKKEKDGSLNYDSGFELVSPVFPFDVTFIKRAIKRWDTKGGFLLNHINADGGSACGFHVTISHPDETPEQIFGRLFHALPLLYALYPSRTENTYCRAPYNPEEYSAPPVSMYYEKYRPVHLKHNCLEIRIFPFLEDVKQLSWRLRLVRALLDTPIASRADMERTVNTGVVNALLREIYGADYNAKMRALMARIAHKAYRYNFSALSGGEPADGVKYRL